LFDSWRGERRGCFKSVTSHSWKTTYDILLSIYLFTNEHIPDSTMANRNNKSLIVITTYHLN
jgi:hypothetical protein